MKAIQLTQLSYTGVEGLTVSYGRGSDDGQAAQVEGGTANCIKRRCILLLNYLMFMVQ